MRRIKFIIVLIICIHIFTACGKEVQTVQVYYADAQLMGLVPVNYEVSAKDNEEAARMILDRLVDGMDANNVVMRLIPDEKGCMRVKIREGTAYVDFSKKSWEQLPYDRDRQRLMVYQIVNSLASVDGVKRVRFSVEGELKTHEHGHIDLRDYFLPDYDI